ncbi:hypothetical protein [Halopiger aswanensis]|uniref:DUF8098 domain-containing protein n=1 Tax=Halopiger aswanensis TaxID=148449 RepID=A0A3R7EFQ8_9EURY|nr:hypothetical protein [Halopiger aswanensis]RKD95649.1 hypothetical protein ATJ93_2510 [Halopiger aswanensis]
MLTLGDEDDLLKDIEEGIQIAMEREGYPSDAIDPIKVNKLAHFAIQDIGVPLTYGWYKYGPAPVFDTSTARLEPTPKREVKAAEEPRLPDPSNEFYSPDEYAYYFTRDCTYFDRILQTPTKEYLIEFYEDHAPSPYGTLYEQSVQVQVILDSIIEDDDWHSEAESYSKSLSKELTELHRELLGIDALSEVVDTFSDYSKLLKRVLAEASTQEELTPSQDRYIRKVANFFYSHVWKYAALIISKNTVHLSPGDNDDKLLNAIDSDLQKLRGEIKDEIHSLEKQGGSRGLYVNYQPDSLDSNSTSLEETFTESNIEPWTKAAAVPVRRKLSRNPEEVDR